MGEGQVDGDAAVTRVKVPGWVTNCNLLGREMGSDESK
jgi:hypothetical protein